MTERTIIEQIHAHTTSDGDGVRLKRVFGGADPERFDPFLMLDDFGSNEPNDYIGGFPPHPHRGFQTVTYMLQGKMEHRDHMGNVGLINDGDVQWMNAGSGVIHSEMPRQTAGLMRGFQLWVNLAASDKMQPAAYRDIKASDIQHFDVPQGQIKVIAGAITLDAEQRMAELQIEKTNVTLADIQLNANQHLQFTLDSTHNVLIYVYEGELLLGATGTPAKAQTLSRASAGDTLTVANETQNSRFLLMSGKPLRQPIVQHGPFVMNSDAEIEQAITDYRNGTLVTGENAFNAS